jgi:hypothetical protein
MLGANGIPHAESRSSPYDKPGIRKDRRDTHDIPILYDRPNITGFRGLKLFRYGRI